MTKTDEIKIHAQPDVLQKIITRHLAGYVKISVPFPGGVRLSFSETRRFLSEVPLVQAFLFFLHLLHYDTIEGVVYSHTDIAPLFGGCQAAVFGTAANERFMRYTAYLMSQDRPGVMRAKDAVIHACRCFELLVLDRPAGRKNEQEKKGQKLFSFASYLHERGLSVFSHTTPPESREENAPQLAEVRKLSIH